MKNYLFALFLISSIPSSSQNGPELMVYTIKGNATVIQDQTETILKIGKVLKPEAIIKLGKDAAVTMICKQGKPLKVNKEGSFPVSNWKDSCSFKNISLTDKYLKYIWGQFYTYSPEYQEQLRKRNEGAVSRSPTNDSQFKPSKKLLIEFSKGIDTLNIGSKDFTLAWTCTAYTGKYQFCLFTNKKRKLILKDSVFRSYISTAKFRDRLETGRSYVWNISAPKSGSIKKRVINIVHDDKIQLFINELLKPIDPEEDSAAIFFRTAYMLENRHFLAEAFIYYKKAVEANPDFPVYSDKLSQFKNEFWVQ